jgi:hypothetical protein
MPSKPYVVSTLVDFGAITESLAEQGFPLFPIKSVVYGHCRKGMEIYPLAFV